MTFMFKNIMVPLDGSKQAEGVLPAALHLASLTGGTVILLHVLELKPPAKVHGDRHLSDRAGAEAYLADLAARNQGRGRISWHVHEEATDNVVGSIAAHNRELMPDLLVMCLHARKGFKSIFFGNIAQQVLAAGRVPILLFRDDSVADAAFECKLILAPFDGIEGHSQGVELAADLAGVCGGTLHLITAVPTLGTLGAGQAASGWLMPGASRELLKIACDDARVCLDRWIDKLSIRGVKVTGEVRRGETAEVIVDSALARDADVIVLATHGKAGAEAFWAGSTAQKIMDRIRHSLLLVPVEPGPV